MEAHAAQKVCRHYNAQKLTESWANGACSHGSASSKSTHFSTSTTGRMAGPPTGKLTLPHPETSRRSSPQKLSRSSNRHRNEEARILPCATQVCCLLLRGLFSAGRHRLRMARTANRSCIQSLAADLGTRPVVFWQFGKTGDSAALPQIVTMMSGASAEELLRHIAGSKATEGRV